jgi:hypothetical protein
MAGTLYEKRLDDNLSTIKSQITDAVSKTSSPSSGGLEAAKRRKK